ncbi:6-bladed beta-propeller [Pedobacter sp. HMF7647]|uniref:6-bladed beta-propeller n=1 Tax=Hufsiella arboris TaxID=2695275 RepID=A0A7K1YEN4_9SPHI|nr:6-bladed beta-propeller [Hufsiella arboris]MXV52479.1 6-bladed beta-propeller [Hufsiella arboris]
MQNNNLIGHNNFRYRVNAGWGNQDPDKYPVKDCHEMVMDKSGLLYLLTNETRNNVLIYTKDGKVKNSWGTNYPGAHGLTLSNENSEEFLYITDTERHQVIKTTLDGKELMILDYPKEISQYKSAGEYKPTETAVSPNGDIYVTDGYGHQFVIQYDSMGNYIRHWGGKGNGDAQFDCVHGIAIDNRFDEPTLLITSRNHNALKRFTMDGSYLTTIHLPGSFICRPVVQGENVYGAVFRSGDNQNMGSGYITLIDKNDKVVSSPGATHPTYVNGQLQPQKQDCKTFFHPHDICVDKDENLYVPQWNSGKTYPLMLERV